MKLSTLVAALLMVFIPFWAEADKGKGKKHKHKHTKAVKAKNGPPSWAPAHGYRNDRHVYFPDYYTFYDPNRGYVYWNNNRWITSPTAPAFMSKADLGSARVQILTSEELTVRPETRYTTIVNQYPGKVVGIKVPIPPRR